MCIYVCIHVAVKRSAQYLPTGARRYRGDPHCGWAARHWGAVLDKGRSQSPPLSLSRAAASTTCGLGKGYAWLWRLLQLGRRLDAAGAPGSPLRRPGVLGTPPAREAGALLSPPPAGRGAGSAARGPRAPGSARRLPRARRPLAAPPRLPGRLPGPPPPLPLAAPRRLPHSPAAEQRRAPQVPGAGGSGARDPAAGWGGGGGAAAAPSVPAGPHGVAPAPARRGVPCRPKPGGCLCTGRENCLPRALPWPVGRYLATPSTTAPDLGPAHTHLPRRSLPHALERPFASCSHLPGSLPQAGALAPILPPLLGDSGPTHLTPKSPVASPAS